LDVFPLRSGKTHGWALLPLLFNIVLEDHAREIRQRKETNGINLGKEDFTFSLFADDLVLYIENPKDYTKTLSELIKKIHKSFKVHNQHIQGSSPSAQ
jgi:hypothetical protein